LDTKNDAFLERKAAELLAGVSVSIRRKWPELQAADWA
jgi:hypothetical protein